MNWILKLLPEDKRNMLKLGMRIVASLDTGAERKEAIDYGIQMLDDGKVSVGEWAKFGSKLGILTGETLTSCTTLPILSFFLGRVIGLRG